MTAQEHYKKHLAHFYSWMAGDFTSKSKAFKQFLIDQNIQPSGNKVAIDLGAGHGLQSIALAELGFLVTAVDFNQHLLNELMENGKGLSITPVLGDIKNVSTYGQSAEVLICWGDTLTHLDSKTEIQTFIEHCSMSLEKKGKLLLSFRDYSMPLTGVDRFIPVKSDDTKILTCVLDYEDESVWVSDVLHEKIEGGWQQKVSEYKKVRISAAEVVRYVEAAKLSVQVHEVANRLVTLVASKKK